MRFFETTPFKALLLPLVPAAAIGIVVLAASTTPSAPIKTTFKGECGRVILQPAPPTPPRPCTDCRAPAPA